MSTFFERPQSHSRAHRATGLSRLGAFLALAAALVLGAAPSAFAGSSAKSRVTFGIAPASARGFDGRSNLSYGVTPGALLADHVAVLNYSSVALSLQVYATDAVETTSGSLGFQPAGAAETQVGAWVSIPPRYATIRVPAESRDEPGAVVVPFLLRVPDQASPGDHVGAIVASLKTAGRGPGGEHVVLLQRVGTRVFVRVSGRLAPALALTGLTTSYRGTADPVASGQLQMSYLVRNDGNVDIAVEHQSVSVSGLLGLDVRLHLAGISLLIPGAVVRESAVVAGVWPQLLVHARAFARPFVLGGGAATPGVTSVSTSRWLWAVPWALLTLVLLLVLVVLAVLRLRARVVSTRLAPRAEVLRA